MDLTDLVSNCIQNLHLDKLLWKPIIPGCEGHQSGIQLTSYLSHSRWMKVFSPSITKNICQFWAFICKMKSKPQPLKGIWSILQSLGLSVQFSHSVVSDSLWPHGLQHARLLSPSPTPRVYSNSCPSSQWCHPTISSSVIPFSFHLQSCPASGSFPVSQFFTSGGQIIGVSASASVLPMNNQDWLPLGWTGWISLLSKRLSRVFSNTTIQKNQFFSPQLSL